MADLKAEVSALRKIERALERFDPDERVRLLNFSLEREGETPAPLEPHQEGLRGGEIATVAVAVLLEHGDNGCSPAKAHYRDWYELVVGQGHKVSGRDPLASFLTNIARHELVEPTTERGVYRLRGPHE